MVLFGSYQLDLSRFQSKAPKRFVTVSTCFFSSTYFMSMISMGEINYSISNQILLFYFIFITSNGE